MNCSFKELIAKGNKVRIYSMDEIVDKFTSSWYSDEDKKELDNVLRNIDFLGIDEFGKNVDKDGNPVYLPELVKRVMESVIRFRVQMNRPIWFASNTDPKFVKDVFSLKKKNGTKMITLISSNLIIGLNVTVNVLIATKFRIEKNLIK